MPRSDFTGDEPVPEPPREPRLERSRRRPYYEDDDDPDRFRRRDDDALSTLIPYKNPKALLAYYLGVFSLIPCAGAVLGPAALILGILGINYANRYPSAKGTGHAITGIVLGSLMSLLHLGAAAFLIIGINKGW